MGLSKFIRRVAKKTTQFDPFGILPENISRRVEPIYDVVAPVLMTAALGPAGGAAYQGLNTYGETGKVAPSVGAAAGSYIGNKIGGNVFGDMGTVGGTLGSGANAIGGAGASNSLGDFFAGGIGEFGTNLLQTPISQIAGNVIGSSLGSSLMGGGANMGAGNAMQGQSSMDTGGLPTTTPFTPTRAADEELSPTLQGQGFGALDPMQQASNLATQGVYGGGVGPEEQGYFTRLINRQLVEPTGNIRGLENLNPIENSYLSQLGLGGASNSNNLLEMLSKWKAA